MRKHRLKNICGGSHFSRNHSRRPSPANVLIILKLFSTRRPKWAIRQVSQMLKAVPGWNLQQRGLWNETGEIRPSGEQRRNKKRRILTLALSWTRICLRHELLCDCGSRASRSTQQVCIQVGLQVIIYSIQRSHQHHLFLLLLLLPNDDQPRRLCNPPSIHTVNL